MVSASYSQQQSLTSSLGRCVRVTAHGKMTAMYGITAKQVFLNSPKIIEPRAYVAVLSSCGGIKRKKVEISISMRYYFWRCEAKPSVSVSAPLGASVSATPTCGSEKVARRVSKFKKGADFSQYSSSGVASWKQQDYDFVEAVLCTHISARIVIYVGNKSDETAFDLGNACVKS